MRIALIDPFFDTSHKLWAEGLARQSKYEIDIYAGSPHHWKWKMTGGTMELAKKLIHSNKKYDLMIVTDMLHLPLFRSLLPLHLIKLPVLLYFHENQITYPTIIEKGKEDRRDRHYGWINYISACQSDAVIFNSQYHKDIFLEALPVFLKAYPKFKWKEDYGRIVKMSVVLPIGLDLPNYSQNRGRPTFIWNHRWEYDKRPELFFSTLIALSKRHIDFDLIVLGKEYERSPPVFTTAKEILSKHIIHWGWVEDKLAYHRLLAKANIMVVTGVQDFFGISIVEAIAVGCFPLLPNRLAYPEHVPDETKKICLYEHDDELGIKIEEVIESKVYLDTEYFSKYVSKYEWEFIIEKYDKVLSSLIANRS